MLATRLRASTKPTYSLDHNESKAAGGDPITWSGVSAKGPLVIAIIHWEYSSLSAGLIDGVTIGGDAMTEVVQEDRGSGVDMGVAIYAIEGDYSAGADVVVNFSFSMDGAHLAVLSIAGVSSATAVDTDRFDSDDTSSVTQTGLTGFASNSVAIIANTVSSGSLVGAYDYTNATKLYGKIVEFDFYCYAGIIIGEAAGNVIFGTGGGGDDHMMIGAVFD